MLSTHRINKIIHMADIHIRKTQDRKEEYATVFQNLYESIERDPELLIVICGDIVDYKTQTYIDALRVTTEFIHNLAIKAPVIVIPGNHDINPHDPQQETVVGFAIEHVNRAGIGHNVCYIGTPGAYQYGNIMFHHIDMEAREVPKPIRGYINIALYHGIVKGARVAHRIFTQTYLTPAHFEAFDYTMLGDIHQLQFLGDNQRIAYPSSLIQQNFGEDIHDHGYIRWDLSGGTHQFIPVSNPYGFVTLHHNGIEWLDYPEEFPEYPRVRIILEDDGGPTSEELHDMEQRWGPITIIRPLQEAVAVGLQVDVENVHRLAPDNEDFLTEEIRKYAVTKEWPPETIDHILEKNHHFMDIIREREDADKGRKLVTSCPQWRLIYMQFHNMFNYGEKNHVNFQELEGNWGFFAKNTAGKTNLLNIIMYLLKGQCLTAIQADDILRHGTVRFCGSIIFDSNGIRYRITRSRRQFHRSKATLERWDTVAAAWTPEPQSDVKSIDNRMHELVPSRDLILMTHIMRSSERSYFTEQLPSVSKAMMRELLRLNLVDELYRLARSESHRLAGRKEEKLLQLHKAEGRLPSDVNHEIPPLVERHVNLQQQKAHLQEQLTALRLAVKNVQPCTVTRSEAQIRESLDHNRQQLTALVITDVPATSLTDIDRQLRDMEKHIMIQVKDGAIPASGSTRQYLASCQRAIAACDEAIDNTTQEWEHWLAAYRCKQWHEFHRRETVLSDHPFNPDCWACRRNPVHRERQRIQRQRQQLEPLTPAVPWTNRWDHYMAAEQECITNWDRVLSHRRSLQLAQCQEAKRQLETERQQLITAMEQHHRDIRRRDTLQLSIQKDEQELSHIEDSQVWTHIRRLEAQDTTITRDLTNVTRQLDTLRWQMAERQRVTTDIGGLQEELQELDTDIGILVTYCEMTNPRGLANSITREFIQPLEVSVNRVLSHIVGFTVSVQMKDDLLVIDKVSANIRIPMANCSGFEKFIVNLAIRFAFIDLGMMQSRFMVLDECFGCVDKENRPRLRTIFDYFRHNLQFAIIISHENWMNDDKWCDGELTIDTNEWSTIRQGRIVDEF